MQRTFWRVSQRLVVRRIDSHRGLERFRAVNSREQALGEILRRNPPSVQSRHDLARYVFLHGDERVIGGRGLSPITYLLGPCRDRRHHRIGVRKYFVLEAQRVQKAEGLSQSWIH